MKYHLYNSNAELLASCDAADIDSATDELIINHLVAPQTNETFELDCCSDHVTMILIREETYIVTEDGYDPKPYLA